jgi:hypothetical protein
MSRLSEVLAKLQRECPVGEDGQPVGITYEAIVEALRIHKIGEDWILQQLRDIVIAELAAGVAAYQGTCGPEIRSATLNITEGRQLVALLKGIVDVQEKLREEQEDSWKRPAPSGPGSDSPDSDESKPKSPSPPTASAPQES